jgi:hypothetical protein
VVQLLLRTQEERLQAQRLQHWVWHQRQFPCHPPHYLLQSLQAQELLLQGRWWSSQEHPGPPPHLQLLLVFVRLLLLPLGLL